MSEQQNYYCTHCLKDFGQGHHCCDCETVDGDHPAQSPAKGIDDIKNNLLLYLLEAVEGNFQHLTEAERGIVGNQEAFDVLLQSINTQGGK